LSAKPIIWTIAIAGGILCLLAQGISVHAAPKVSLTPAGISLTSSQTQASPAYVTGKSNPGVTWSLNPAVGSISLASIDTASTPVSAAETVTVTATAVANSAQSASASVWLSSPIPASLFGLTVLDYRKLAPRMKFGTTRSWDAHPNLDWSDVNPSAGVYNFTFLDRFIALNQARGAEIIYTFGRTPQWASSRPTASTPYGPGECAPPAEMSSWDSYVSAIATHVAGKIKYWEVWNEPDQPDSYCGDVASLVTMAQHAAHIIKTSDPGAVILSPSVTGPPWLSSFLSQGGGDAVDIIAVHGYSSIQAGDIATITARYRALLGAHGVSAKPIWDTESSWAGSGKSLPVTAEQQAAFIAKDYLLHWSAGIPRFVWYAYDGGSIWGGLLTSGGAESSAVASYRETYQWLVGATLTDPCSEAANHVWTCNLSRPGGYTAQVAWISNRMANYPVPAQYVEYRDLAGVIHPIATSTIPIGDTPILLESAPLP
jgi:hypothetical protein